MRTNISAFPAKSWLAFSLCLVAFGPGTLPSLAADTVAIRNIYLNQDKQLVVEFDNPTHTSPSAPQVLDCPGDKHDIVIEFTNTSFAVGKVPRAKAVLDELTKAFPNVSSIAYAASNDSAKARLRLSVSKDVTTHPTLAKVDQDSAIINLDLPAAPPATAAVPAATAAPAEDTTTAPAATSSAPAKTVTPATTTATTSDTTTTTPAVTTATTPDTATTAPATATPPAKNTEQPAPTTTSDANSTAPNNGLTSKAMHGIKGAWQSSLKVGSAPMSKFAKLFGSNNKQADSQNSADQEAPSSVASTKTTDTTSASPAVTPVAVSADTTPAAPTTVAADSPKPITIASTVATPINITAEQSPAVKAADNITDNTPNPASVQPQQSKPEATPGNADQLTSSPAPNPDADKRLLDLPRITMQTHENNNELITPLKADEVKPEQKSELASANLVEPARPLSTKTITGDSSVIDDLKTSFAPKDIKETGKPAGTDSTPPVPAATEALAQTESQPKIASVTANETTSSSSKGAAISKVELKPMNAQSGGKDYFPPKVTAEGQESTYNDETLKHYNEAVRFHLAGKLPEAIAEYRAALVGNPRMEEAHSNLGLIFNQQNKYDQAMIEFHKALAINPKDAITYNGIGAAMRAQKNMLAAVKNWQTAISLDPNLASAHYNLGTAYEIDKDLEKALTEYKLAVKYDDKLGEAYYHMGLILEKMNNRSLALEQFKQAVKVSAEADYSQDAKHRMNLLSQKKDINM